MSEGERVRAWYRHKFMLNGRWLRQVVIADVMWSAVGLRVGTDDKEELIDFDEHPEFKAEQEMVLDWLGVVISGIRLEIGGFLEQE